MKSKLAIALLPIVLLVSSEASAHFKLEAPGDALQTNATGDPTGGDQKTAPCGTGTAASAVVTRKAAGSTLHIKLTETVAHGGHYRIALVPTPNKATLVDPVPVVTANNCVSAPIQATPVAPVLADGLFVHAQADFASGKVWETDVTLPKTLCPSCTLQIIEFMTPHAPNCFYHHCANLEIVDPDAGGLDDGGIVVDDGGSSGSSGSSGGTSGSSGGTSGSSGGTSGSSGGTSGSTTKPAAPPSDGGCNVTGDATPSLVSMGLFGLMVVSMVRRRRRAA